MSRRATLALFTLISLSGLACSSKLETGYEPNRLNATPQQRRAYYAAPFSPESRAAPDRDDALDARRPRPGY